jgi:adenosylcobinamide-GDP ribazoletransferase
MNLYRWLLLALQFATILPTPRIEGVEEADMRRSVAFLPFVGLLLGAILWLVDWCLRFVLPLWPSAVVALAVYTACSGALHLDGWMDTADALGSRRPRDEALAIMKDSRVGAIGVVCGILLLLTKASCLAVLPVSAPVATTRMVSVDTWLLWVPMLSRLGMVWAMRLAPAARPGEGLGAVFASRVPIAAVASASGMALVTGFVLLPPLQVLSALALASVLCMAFTAFMRRRLGGMTGDTYGALNELLEAFLWLLASAFTKGA